MTTDTLTIENETGQIVKAEQQRAEGLLEVAQSYQIDSPEMADAAADDLGDIKAKIKALNDQRLSMTRPLDEAKKRIMDLFARPLETLQQAEGTLKKAIADWTAEQRRIAEEERRKAEEAARKEQQRLEAERQAAEKAAREEQERLRREAEEAAKAGNEAAAKAAQEESERVAEEARQQALINEQEQHAMTAMAATAAPAAQKLAGISTRENWKGECCDLMALVKAVAAGEASIELLEPNAKEITKRAKALRSEFKVPGIRVWPESVVSARAKS